MWVQSKPTDINHPPPRYVNGFSKLWDTPPLAVAFVKSHWNVHLNALTATGDAVSCDCLHCIALDYG